MHPIDWLIAQFAPAAAARRIAARHAIRAYEGANTADGWKPRRSGASADADHLADARKLRDRARALEQNTPYIKRALANLTASTIGTGIAPDSRAGARVARRLNDAWEQWGPTADADGVLDINGIQAMAYHAMERDGEVLIRRRINRALPVPMQLQVLEADYLDTDKAGPAGDGQIVNGVEYDGNGRAVAYWLWPVHPGSTRFQFRTASQRVPAEEIIHLYRPDRPGQGRGITRLHPVIAMTRDLALYQDAELQRKNLETRLGIIASGPVNDLANPVVYPSVDGTGVADLGALPSGGMVQLPPGLTLDAFKPDARPGTEAYIKLQLQLIAAGIGVPYEAMVGDMSEVNFSSARVRILDYRREVEAMQWLTVIPRLCMPIWRWFVDSAALAGVISRPDYAVDWATPRWDYVNPEQDVKAEIAAIGAGLMSPTESLRRRGYKPATVYAEMGADLAAMRESNALELMQAISGRGQVSAVQG